MKAADLIKKCKAYPFAFVVALLTIVLIAFTYIRSMENSKLDIRHNDAVKAWNKIDANVFKNSVNLEMDLEAAESISQDLQNRLVHPPELATNYQYFFRLESVAAVKILSLQQETLSVSDKKNANKKKEKPLFSQVPYTMGASGEFHEIVSFLYALENGEHFYHLKECTLQRDTRSDESAISTVMKFDLLGTP